MNYRVKNWSKFQHYKDRNPPWIKLHWELLSSMDWVTLDDASRVLAVVCMLVASRNNGEIRGDLDGLKYLKRVAHLNKNPDLKPLISCGLLEPASDLLAPCKQDARPEEEEERLTETPIAASGKQKRPGPVSWSESEGFKIPPEFMAALVKAAPAVDVQIEINKAHAWAMANPKNRKSNWGAFLDRWLRKAQDSAPRKGGHSPDQFAGAL